MVDLDGKFSYSKIEVVKIQNNSNFRAFPNPCINGFTVKSEQEKNINFSIRLYNSIGQEIYCPIVSGINEIFVNTSNIESGTYLLMIYEGNKVTSKIMVK
jgi:hypothetical protein